VPDDLPDDCDAVTRFEDAWRRGERPDLAALLPAGGPLRRAVLRELAHVELELRLRDGEPVRAADYLDRFPELADDDEAAASLVRAESDLRRRFGQRRTAVDEEGSTCDTAAGGAGGPVPGYVILRELGRGRKGVVFLARDEVLRRQVVLRVFPPDPAATRRDALTRRGQIAGWLGAIPGVAALHAVCEAGEHLFWVLEYVAGGTLAEQLARGPLPPNDAARLVLTLAEAIQTAHDAGFAHGKLKPHNVLLADDVPKIADFGLHDGTPASDVADLKDLLRACVGCGAPAGLAAVCDADHARAADLAADLRRWLDSTPTGSPPASPPP
jgi:serine/threonine protein kinase